MRSSLAAESLSDFWIKLKHVGIEPHQVQLRVRHCMGALPNVFLKIEHKELLLSPTESMSAIHASQYVRPASVYHNEH